MTFEDKLNIVERNGRRMSIVEAAIARDAISKATTDFHAAIEQAAEKFNLDCWNGFSSEFSQSEIESMASHEKHCQNSKNETVS